MKRWMLWIGILIVIVAVGAGAYNYYFARDEGSTTQVPTSQTMKASRSNIEVKISGTGTVTVDSRDTVTAGTNGTIEKLGFKVGDTVKKGQVLVVFETDDVSGQISQLELSMKKQKLQMTQYETQYKEATGTEKEADTKQSIENSMELLKLDMEQNEQSLSDLYEQQADTAQVVAQIDGKITASDVAVGDEVQGNAVIAEIVDYTALSFVIQVDELDIPQMKVGQVAQVHLNALPDTTFEGTVAELAQEGTASNGVAAYDVTIALSNIEGIIAGMSGQADIIIESKQDVVVVPVDAVVELRGATFVRVPGTGSTATGAVPTGGGASGGAQEQQGGQGAASGSQGEQGAQGAQGAEGAQDAQGAQGENGGRGSGTQAGAAAVGMTGPGGMQMEGRLQKVTIGISNETYVEIVSGLEEGDSVLVPLPQGTIGTASSQTQTGIPGGFGGMGGMQFPAGGMGGGGGFASGAGSARGQGGGQ